MYMYIYIYMYHISYIIYTHVYIYIYIYTRHSHTMPTAFLLARVSGPGTGRILSTTAPPSPVALTALLVAVGVSWLRPAPPAAVEPVVAISTAAELRSEIRELRAELQSWPTSPVLLPEPTPAAPPQAREVRIGFWRTNWKDFFLGFGTAVCLWIGWRAWHFGQTVSRELRRILSDLGRARYRIEGTPLRLHQ